jgi:phosphoenolpyruvate carboxylase
MDKKVLQEIHNNETLYQDINMLDGMLNEIIVCLEGRELANTLERIRRKAKALRDNHSQENYRVLKNEIDALDDATRKKVIRAFTVFLYLFNIAEQNFRVRIRRRYQLDESDTQPDSIEDTVKSLKDRQVDETIVNKILNTVSLELITTAHPTESTKRTILDIQRRIVGVLRKLEQRLLTNRERITLKETLFNDIAILWQTDELRRHKPTVYDEVESGLYYFDQTLFEVLPEIHRELEMNLSEQYPEKKWRVPNFLSFGTWIGGDRDGNPFVTHDVTWKTMLEQRELVIKKYIAVLQDLTHRYTHTTSRMTVDENFAIRLNEMEEKYLTPKTKWKKKGEVYRRYFAVIIERVSQVGKSEIGYKTAEELLEDLFFVQKSLREHHPAKHELKTIQKIIRQVQLFGFHLATLDIRNHSGEHESAIAEILQKVGLAKNYSKMIESEKVKLLTSILQDPRRVLLNIEDYTPETQEMIRVFQTIKQIHDEFGTRAIEVYLISMFKSPSDLLEVLVLAKEANLYRLHANGKVESYLNVAPLLETIDDLTAAPCIMEKIFNMPLYRRHLQMLDNRQEIMFGYSDSSKDGGTLTASWKLFKAQIEIHKMALHYGVDLKFFHGRGGSLGRGGGTLNRSLTSQPAETIDVGLKITEQGEVLSFRYLIEDIAYRSLEQAVAALLQIAVKVNTNTDIEAFRKKNWEDAFEKIAAISHKKYRSLVFDEPEFINYFYEATPLIEIGGLNIGSRPIARKNLRGFEYLRAIPWVFSWAQCRQMLPAWFAAGTGLTAFANEKPENLALMQEMYAKWPFFRNTIDNLQLALLKADMLAASEYVTLVKNQKMANRIFDTIKEEYAKTEKIALQISGDKELYAQDENLRQSTIERNPYVEVLNFLQVDLINKLRSSTEPDAELMEQVLLTINGISVGIRSTG